MNRRRALAALFTALAGGLTGASVAVLADGRGAASRQGWPLLPDGSWCRVRPPAAVPAARARTAGALAYEGTHILALGALRELAVAFNKGTGRLLVTGGGCDDGVAAVRRGVADLGGLCCPVEGSSAEGLPWLPVARDIKAVISHPDTKVASLSLAQLRAVARGEIRRWPALGGEPRAIAQVVRRHCPDYFEPVRVLLLDNRPVWSERALFVDTDEQIVETVARFPGSLGLVSGVFAGPLVQAGRLKVLTVGGAPPTLSAVTAGDYRLTGPLNLVFPRWGDPRLVPFFDFLYGPRGRAILARALVPVSAEEAGYSPERFAATV